MQNAIVVRGRLTGPQSIELTEPVSGVQDDVEVVFRIDASKQSEKGQSVFEFLRTLPPGTLSREEMDQRLAEERDSWRDD